MHEYLSRTVQQYFGLSDHVRYRYPKFAMAAEIETEGTRLPNFNDISQPYWKTIPEGSLRNGGLEHVFRTPLVAESLDDAFKVWDENTVFTEFVDSIRTSVHLHYNVRDLTLLSVYSVIAAYWLVENILVQLNGNTRVGNLFCLRVKDAEYSCQGVIVECERNHFFMETTQDTFRYSALNLAALRKFGSLEFRFLRGYHESNVIKQWMLELQTLVKKASEFEHPEKLLEFVRSIPPSQVLKHFFSETFRNHIYNTLGPRAVGDMMKENEVYIERLVNALNTKPKKLKLKVIDEDMPGRDQPPEVVSPDTDYLSPMVSYDPVPPPDWEIPDEYIDETEEPQGSDPLFG